MTVRSRSAALLALILVLATLAGCRKKHAPAGPPPDPRRWVWIHFVHDVTVAGVDHPLALGDRELVGATLVVDGTAQPMPVEESAEGDVTASAAFDPIHAFADHSVKLALRLPSPCGTPVELPLEYTSSFGSTAEERADKSGKVTLRRTPSSAAHVDGAFTVWVDDRKHPNAKVTFGKIEITGKMENERTHAPLPGRRMRLWDLSCAPQHDVTVDGKPFGTAKPAGGKETAFLVSLTPGTCYEKRVAEYTGRYRPNAAPDTVIYVPAAPVTDVGWSKLDWFLTGAPSGSDVSAQWGIDDVPCDDTRISKRR